jgi:hypothetical protein
MPTGVYKRKPLSKETKDKIKNKLLGKKGSEQKSINLSKALKGKPKSKEFIEHLRKIRTGWKLSDETRKKISIKLKGNKNSVGSGHPPNQKSVDALVKHTKENGVWNKGMIGYGAGKNHHWHGKDNSGENNPRWIKDRTKLCRISKQGERRTSVYFNWRKEVWKRDGWGCMLNGDSCNGNIVAHHIKRWIDYPELRYDIKNGITLCQAHHPRKRAEEKRLIPVFQGLVSVSN